MTAKSAYSLDGQFRPIGEMQMKRFDELAYDDDPKQWPLAHVEPKGDAQLIRNAREFDAWAMANFNRRHAKGHDHAR